VRAVTAVLPPLSTLPEEKGEMKECMHTLKYTNKTNTGSCDRVMVVIYS